MPCISLLLRHWNYVSQHWSPTTGRWRKLPEPWGCQSLSSLAMEQMLAVHQRRASDDNLTGRCTCFWFELRIGSDRAVDRDLVRRR